MPSPDTRTRMAEQQARLVQALTSLGETPAGFDAQRVQVAAESLVFKRRRTVARVWPGVVKALGESRFRTSFLDFARAHALPTSAMPIDDGLAFARWLTRSGESVPDAVRIELLQVEMTRGFPWPVRLIRLPEAKRWLLALRLPFRRAIRRVVL